MPITSIKMQIELLTPAFLGSASTRMIDPYMPLRPPAVRGLLRAWFRMAAASLLWPRDDTRSAQEEMVAELRKIEGRFFGQALDSGAGRDQSRRSPFAVLPTEGGLIYKYREHGVPDPRREPGLRYLGYGLFDDRNRPPEALLTPKGDLLTLHLRVGDDPPELLRVLGATLWLWLSLGGLGARSRRGFGSLRVHADCGAAIPWPRLPVSQELPESRQELLNRLMEGLDAALDVFREVLPRHTHLPLEKSGAVPHQRIRTLAGLQSAQALPITFKSPAEAMEFTGTLMRDFRSTLRRNALGLAPLPDYFGVKQALQSRLKILPVTVERAAFGLPLPFYFRSLNGQKCRLEPRGRDRLPSPLHLRVHALAQGCAMVLLNFTEGMDVLLGETLTIDGAQVSTPDGKILRQFIEWASKEAAASPLARGPLSSTQGGRR